MSGSFGIRYLDTDPYGRAGAVVGHFDAREEAEAIAREMPNRAHVEVVER